MLPCPCRTRHCRLMYATRIVLILTAVAGILSDLQTAAQFGWI